MSSFNPNIPNAGDLLSDSQPELKTNNQALDNVFFINHYKFSDTTGNKGKHRWVEMPSLGVNVPPNPLVGIEGTIYTNRVTRLAVPETQMFYISEANGQRYQLTQSISAQYGQFGTNTALPAGGAAGTGGWTFLPGGLILQYGKAAGASLGTITVKFPIPFSAVPFVVNLQYTIDNNSTDIRLGVLDGSVTPSQFQTIQSNTSHLIDVYFMAIGT